MTSHFSSGAHRFFFSPLCHYDGGIEFLNRCDWKASLLSIVTSKDRRHSINWFFFSWTNQSPFGCCWDWTRNQRASRPELSRRSKRGWCWRPIETGRHQSEFKRWEQKQNRKKNIFTSVLEASVLDADSNSAPMPTLSLLDSSGLFCSPAVEENKSAIPFFWKHTSEKRTNISHSFSPSPDSSKFGAAATITAFFCETNKDINSQTTEKRKIFGTWMTGTPKNWSPDANRFWIASPLSANALGYTSSESFPAFPAAIWKK